MDTVNGLSAAQIHELLQPLEKGWYIEEKDGQYRLRHEYVRARLTQIFGFNGWGEEDLELTRVHESTDKQGFMTVAYVARQRLVIRNQDGTTRNSFDGAGAWGRATSRASQLPVWELYSDVINGARTVALCRAAMSYGSQFGLSLYSPDPGNFTVGYSLPHVAMLSHLYGAGDAEEPDATTASAELQRQGSP